MAGLSQIMEIARRSMLGARVGMNTTSHNISNASTTGYSRQRVEFTETTPLPQTFGYLGTGVTISSIERLHDQFLDQQYRTNNGTFGDASIRQGLLSQVEATFDEPSDAGLSSALTKFFTSFQDLSIHPEDSSSRNAVIQQGVLLTQSFHRLNTDLTNTRGDLINEVNGRLDTINKLTDEISSLDEQITQARASGGEPNDLLDQLDTHLDNLSKLANIQVTRDSSGSVMVSISGILVAASGGSTKLESTMVGGQLQILDSTSGRQVKVGGGELGGLVTTYNTTIPGYLSQIDQLAGAIISRVNAVHSAGYSLGSPATTGTAFFTGTDSATIQLNSAITSDPNLIAASSDGAPGNNTTALALAGIADEKIMTGGTVTALQYYNGLVSSLGADVNSADNISTTHQQILTQLDTQRSATSGVSLDEEMTNLIQFQRAFDAAAKIVSTVDQMYQTIIDMKAL
jgi:flagellar hook-associated protein 1